MTAQWTGLTALDQGRAIGEGRIDPVDLTETYLSAIAASPHKDDIYVRLTESRARAEAKAARKRAADGTRLSQLDGVPISWKDLYDTAGIATESGSRLLAGRTPDTDARVLQSATRSGLVCLGKTHQTELAFSGLGLNPVTRTPPNINDDAVVPGGSSSGAGSSVAHGLAAAGIGSDTGGSVRIPAAWNNLVGMKTTHGLLPLTGVVPLCARFDTVGPLTRSVDDANHLVAAMAGAKPADLSGGDPKRLRLLVCETIALDSADTEPLEAFTIAMEALQSAGVSLARSPVPEVADALALSGPLFAGEAYGTWKDRIEANPDVMFAPVRDRFRAGATFSAVDYVSAWQKLDDLRDIFVRRLRPYDAMVVPTSAIMPPNIQRLLNDEAYFTDRNLLALRNTRIGNLMGTCALTLPTRMPACGLMLIGRPYQDAALMRTGATLEKIVGPQG